MDNLYVKRMTKTNVVDYVSDLLKLGMDTELFFVEFEKERSERVGIGVILGDYDPPYNSSVMMFSASRTNLPVGYGRYVSLNGYFKYSMSSLLGNAPTCSSSIKGVLRALKYKLEKQFGATNIDFIEFYVLKW